MSRMRTKTPTFRFNRNEDDLLEEVYDRSVESSVANTSLSSADSTNISLVNSPPKSDMKSESKADRPSVKEYITSRLNKNRGIDEERDKDRDRDKDLNTSNWFHDFKGKIKEKIEEKKREKEMKSVVSEEFKCNEHDLLNKENVNEKVVKSGESNDEKLSFGSSEANEKQVPITSHTTNTEPIAPLMNAFDDKPSIDDIHNDFLMTDFNESIDHELIDNVDEYNRSIFWRFRPLYLITCSAVAFISFLVALLSPLPTFLNGLLLGIFLTILLLSVLIVLIVSKFFIHKCVNKKLKTNTKIMRINCKEEQKYKGWMYELMSSYEFSKSGLKTQLIYVRLEGQSLRLSKPKQDNRKLKLDSNHLPLFVSQRFFDLSKMVHKKVYLLLPKNIKNQRKYIWSKKYPIGVELEDNKTKSIVKLILFIRNCRDKEEWFWKFREAIDCCLICSSEEKENTISGPPSPRSLGDIIPEDLEHLPRTQSLDLSFLQSATNSSSTTVSPTTPSKELQILSQHIDYHVFMKNILNFKSNQSSSLTWFNAIIGRVCFDILNEQFWSNWVATKIQRKLRRIRLPYFMESLTITEIDIGNTLPNFNNVPNPPFVDSKGLWIDFEFSYSGGFTMTLETKLNLMKLKEQGTGSQENKSFHNDIDLSDNDSDSIISSSEEEIEDKPIDPEVSDDIKKQQKILKFVDKITSSQYFQKATENKYIKRAMEGVSKTSLNLTVQILTLNGTLAINIPEPPTDRLWYGFRGNPDLVLSARPKLGEHEVSIHQVTDIIERKLRQEFAKILVMPNMDDLIIPVLMTNIDQYITVV